MSSMQFPETLIDRLRAAKHVTVLTGSGVSAESGVPTFREAQTGLWERYNPEELATAQAFRRNPHLVWEWYQWRRELIAAADPNDGHQALVDLEKLVPQFSLVTQNVDGLHHRAGSRQVIELHGNIHQNKCFAENTIVESWNEQVDGLPRCPSCGSWLRPDVVWFGESLPRAALAQALQASRKCDIFFSVGTSAMVQPAASLPHQAQAYSATIVEINLETTPLSGHADFILRGHAGVVLPTLVRQMVEARQGRS